MTPDDPFQRGAIPDGDAPITADDAETARLDDSVGIQGAASPDDLSGDDLALSEDDPDYRPAREGRLVFRPGELNNAGEDKEYFHPKKHHHFDVPKDANNHAITPDVEVAPGNKVRQVRKQES